MSKEETLQAINTLNQLLDRGFSNVEEDKIREKIMNLIEFL